MHEYKVDDLIVGFLHDIVPAVVTDKDGKFHEVRPVEPRQPDVVD